MPLNIKDSIRCLKAAYQVFDTKLDPETIPAIMDAIYTDYDNNFWEAKTDAQ